MDEKNGGGSEKKTVNYMSKKLDEKGQSFNEFIIYLIFVWGLVLTLLGAILLYAKKSAEKMLNKMKGGRNESNSAKNATQTKKSFEKTRKKEAPEENPLKILKLRLAKGEITKKEYEEMKKALET